MIFFSYETLDYYFIELTFSTLDLKQKVRLVFNQIIVVYISSNQHLYLCYDEGVGKYRYSSETSFVKTV